MLLVCQFTELHAATSFIDVTEGRFIFKPEIGYCVNRDPGDVEIVVGQQNVDRKRGAILLFCGSIANGDTSTADIDDGPYCYGGGPGEGDDAVYYRKTFASTAFDKVGCIYHLVPGCESGVINHLLQRTYFTQQIRYVASLYRFFFWLTRPVRS